MVIRSYTFTSSGSTLLSPYISVHKFAAIVLDDVERVVVGDSSLDVSVSANNISHSRYGIVTRKSSLEVFNNTFENLLAHDEPWPDNLTLPSTLVEAKRSSIGVLSYSAFDYHDRNIWIGERTKSDPQVNETRNHFENLDVGIWSEDETNLEIHHSSFGYGSNDPTNGVTGIRINYPGNKHLSITHENFFDNYKFGIRMRHLSASTSMVVSDNTFEGGFSVNNRFTGTAIYVSNWGPLQSGEIRIATNNFGKLQDDGSWKFPRIGIRAANIFNTLAIEGNQMTFDFVDVPGDYNTGIWLMNCAKAKVIENSIANNSTPGIVEDFDRLLVGINVQNSMLTCIDDQSFTYLGQPLRFFGNSILQSLSNNTMDHFSQGLFLDLAEIGQVIPGVNTVGGNSYVDWVNSWIQPVGADEKRRISGAKINQIRIDWWHSAANNTDSKFPGGDASLVRERQIPSNSTVLQGSLCPVEDESEPPFDLTSRNANFGAVAADTARYETDIEKNRYESSLELFSLLKAYPSLLDFGDTSDIGFVDFYENQLGSNIEKVVDIMNHLKQADYANGYALLSELIDTCEWETNFKLVTSAYLNTLTTGQAFTSRDSVVLDSVAHLNVYSYGVPVQFARNILDLEIYDAPSGGARKAQPRKVIRELDYLVLIPNPAHDVVKIKIPDNEIIVETILLDPIGKVIYHQNALSRLNIGHLREGIYQVQVKTHHKTRIGKLVIIK